MIHVSKKGMLKTISQVSVMWSKTDVLSDQIHTFVIEILQNNNNNNTDRNNWHNSSDIEVQASDVSKND